MRKNTIFGMKQRKAHIEDWQPKEKVWKRVLFLYNI